MTIEFLNNLPPLNFPMSTLKLRENADGSLSVFDSLRDKYVRLTPEEYVRQNFVYWLINVKSYPKTLLNNEVCLKLNDTIKRCDTVLFTPESKPLMIIEYKAPDIVITQSVFNQIYRYNLKLKASYLIVTNGIKVYCCKVDDTGDGYTFIQEIPNYDNLK